MKTLAFIGSARAKGNTRALLELFLERLGGDAEVISCYKLKVSPCVDCRQCLKVNQCSISDGMEEIFQKVEAAERIVFASPVYCFSVPGPMKVMIDRFQVYWAALVRQDKPQVFHKKGAILLTGGGPLFPNQFTGAQLVLEQALHDLNTTHMGSILMDDADHSTPAARPDILEKLAQLAGLFNG